MGRYNPGNPPDDTKDIKRHLIEEGQKISQALDTPNGMLMLEKLYAAPAKFRDGSIVLADGTTWDPGSGAGFYGYRDGAWRFIA